MTPDPIASAASLENQPSHISPNQAIAEITPQDERVDQTSRGILSSLSDAWSRARAVGRQAIDAAPIWTSPEPVEIDEPDSPPAEPSAPTEASNLPPTEPSPPIATSPSAPEERVESPAQAVAAPQVEAKTSDIASNIFGLFKSSDRITTRQLEDVEREMRETDAKRRRLNGALSSISQMSDTLRGEDLQRAEQIVQQAKDDGLDWTIGSWRGRAQKDHLIDGIHETINNHQSKYQLDQTKHSKIEQFKNWIVQACSKMLSGFHNILMNIAEKIRGR